MAQRLALARLGSPWRHGLAPQPWRVVQRTDEIVAAAGHLSDSESRVACGHRAAPRSARRGPSAPHSPCRSKPAGAVACVARRDDRRSRRRGRRPRTIRSLVRGVLYSYACNILAYSTATLVDIRGTTSRLLVIAVCRSRLGRSYAIYPPRAAPRPRPARHKHTPRAARRPPPRPRLTPALYAVLTAPRPAVQGPALPPPPPRPDGIPSPLPSPPLPASPAPLPPLSTPSLPPLSPPCPLYPPPINTPASPASPTSPHTRPARARGAVTHRTCGSQPAALRPAATSCPPGAACRFTLSVREPGPAPCVSEGSREGSVRAPRGGVSGAGLRRVRRRPAAASRG